MTIRHETREDPRNGWKTCSRGHHYRGERCQICWPGRTEKSKRPPQRVARRASRAAGPA